MRHRINTQRVRWRDKLVRAVEQGVRQALVQQHAAAEEQAERRHRELLDAQRAWERRQRRDVFTALDQDAARSSAELLRTELQGGRLHADKHDTLRNALEQSPAQGLALEFGVATGSTLRIIAEHRTDTVYGFDSFEGLPERWRLGFDTGEFATDVLPDVAGAELVVGWFEDTLPGFLAEHPGPVAFLHVDCDLYSSTRTVLDLTGPRFVAGTVITFDEYYNYPGWQEHEYRAWHEYVERSGLEFEYVGLTMDDEQVSVRITCVPITLDPAPATP